MKSIALITGASRGIGRSTAIEFAKNGYQLILTGYHSPDALQELCQQIRQNYHVSVLSFLGDIGSADFVAGMFEQIQKEYGHLDVLINNAGIAHIGLLHEMTPEAWNQVLQTNLTGAFLTCRQAIPLMLQQHKGKILNVSSVWGNVGASMEVAYSASKGGLNAFTKALAKELAPSGIQVNALSCGCIDTEMNHHLSTEDKDCLVAEIPADRFGLPEEVAQMLFQLSHAPDYLTGQIVTLDGGWI